MRVQKYAFLAGKTEKTAKNRPRLAKGSFSEENNPILLANTNKRSYPDFVSLIYNP
jgi:hypothetical protein